MEFPLSMFIRLGIGWCYIGWNKFMHSPNLKNRNFNQMIEAVGNGAGGEFFDKWNDEIKAEIF